MKLFKKPKWKQKLENDIKKLRESHGMLGKLSWFNSALVTVSEHDEMRESISKTNKRIDILLEHLELSITKKEPVPEIYVVEEKEG